MSLHGSDPIRELRCQEMKVDVWLGSTTRAGGRRHAAACHASAQLTHSCSAGHGHAGASEHGLSMWISSE